MITIDEKWEFVLNTLSDAAARKVIYVMGASDSGKTIFCQFLYKKLSQNFHTAYIDCDPGQSMIGPPTTIGMTMSFQSAPKQKRDYCYFIGSTTPKGHLLQTLTGVKKLTEQAIYMGAQRVILDSCGFVLDKSAREFQFQLIHLLQPHHLIIIQRSNEISRWAGNFKKHPRIRLHSLPVSPAVIPRSPSERKTYREAKFKEYFESAKSQELLLKGISFHGRIPDLRNPEQYQNLLVALCDPQHFVITLGIIQKIDLANKIFCCYASNFDPAKVATIYFGSIYLNLDGKQIFPL